LSKEGKQGQVTSSNYQQQLSMTTLNNNYQELLLYQEDMIAQPQGAISNNAWKVAFSQKEVDFKYFTAREAGYSDGVEHKLLLSFESHLHFCTVQDVSAL
jgi:hypothetical protein